MKSRGQLENNQTIQLIMFQANWRYINWLKVLVFADDFLAREAIEVSLCFEQIIKL